MPAACRALPLLAAGLLACAAPLSRREAAPEGGQRVVVGIGHDGRSVRVPLGYRFLVRLPGSRAEGYWEVSRIDGRALERLGGVDCRDDASGLGGSCEALFLSVQAGPAEVSLEFHGPQETYRTFRVTAQVVPGDDRIDLWTPHPYLP